LSEGWAQEGGSCHTSLATHLRWWPAESNDSCSGILEAYHNATAVLYYLGNFPDVFSLTDLAAACFRWILRSLVFFPLAWSHRFALERGWGDGVFKNGMETFSLCCVYVSVCLCVHVVLA
jgi:hypothetical protein